MQRIFMTVTDCQQHGAVSAASAAFALCRHAVPAAVCAMDTQTRQSPPVEPGQKG